MVQPVIETVTRRETPGRRPPTADKARQRAFSLGQNTERGRLARQVRSAGVSPAIRERTEKPRERGFEIRHGIETATRRETPGRRPPAAEKARQRACAWVDSPARPWREAPSTGLRIGRYHATTKGRELITVLCRSQHVTLQQLRAYPESSFSRRGRDRARANAHQDRPERLVATSAALTPGPSPASGRGEVAG